MPKFTCILNPAKGVFLPTLKGDSEEMKVQEVFDAEDIPPEAFMHWYYTLELRVGTFNVGQSQPPPSQPLTPKSPSLGTKAPLQSTTEESGDDSEAPEILQCTICGD